MNDQQNPYDPYQQPQIVGYDEYGQPVYQQAQQQYQEHQQYKEHQQYQDYSQYQQPQQQYDPYAQQQTYGYESYPQGGSASQPQPQPYDAYAQQPQQGQDYGHQGYTGHGTAQPWTPQESARPQQHQRTHEQPRSGSRPDPAPRSDPDPAPAPAAVPGQRRREREPAAQDREYRTEQFSFVEEPDEDSEDVIDWLKFTESRSERREEAKRRGRNRIVVLAVVLAVALVGGAGYLWAAGELPGQSDAPAGRGGTASGPQKRDTIVLHLHNTRNKDTSTALLVDNATTKQGTTVLLPNALAVVNDDGTTTTLAKSVDEDGSTGTREAIGTLLGTRISGTWRLDTPYLENLVEMVGGIDLTTDTTVPGAGKGDPPLVAKGENQTLTGPMAVAYATHRGPGEPETAQLQRFGQVVNGVLRKMSDDPRAATVTVETLAQILDPSLPEKDLGASLARLAGHAKVGDHRTALLPVRQDGTLDEEAARDVVKDILGGTVSAPEQGAAVRVGVRNASGNGDATEAARIVLVNGGYAVIDGGKADRASSSQVIYGDPAQKAHAEEVAKTLGLPADAVQRGTAAANADVTVLLGRDYRAG
ncbi:LytR C-terminal domain-containing protein [Streptomyces sp. NPDC050856]|uniref:LCP family protein n=1 Tax=Streptomyces sp. NPDC050856 TaxID=3154939 RepID=UPI0033CAA807